MKTKEIQSLLEAATTPGMQAALLTQIAGEYAFCAGQLEEVLVRRPTTWLALRHTLKTDKAADRAYEATDDGLNETGLRLRMKAMEQVMSSLKTRIRIAEGEARNTGY